MNESAPPVPVRRSLWARWRRARIYVWAILVIFALWLMALVVVARYHPKRLVDHALGELPFPTSTGDVSWSDPRTLKIKDMKLGQFFYAESVFVSLNGRNLLRGHISAVKVYGCQVFTKALDEELKKFNSYEAQLSSGLDWTLDLLEIRRGTVMVEDFAPDTPAIPILLGAARPIILRDINLGRPNASPSMTVERTVEIENVNLASPFDPLAPVLAFPLTRMRFTYNELWHHHIRELDFISPTIYLGQDLFWFTDEFKKTRNAAPSEGVNAPWDVGHLEAHYGQLAINAFGQPTARLPFFFQTKVDNIRLDQLDKISAKSTIPIVRFDQDYPDYKLNIVNLHGNLEFSLPPSDDTANNVVSTVKIDKISWHGIPATEVWTSVTFDPNGIYGNLGGNCESGYLKANFEIYYTKGFTWNIDFFADKINCQPVAQKIVGKYLSMTGTLDGDIAIQGKTTNILAAEGTLDLETPGVVEIKTMDDLLKKLPTNLSILKGDLLKIAVHAFQTYPYENGQLKVDYKPDGGTCSLKLNSPNGPRHLDIVWHPYDEKQGKDNAHEVSNP